MLMVVQTFKAALSLLRARGFSAVGKKGGEKISSVFATPIQSVHDVNKPVWAVSDIDLHSYCFNSTEYVNAQTQANQDVELTIDTSDVDTIEVPIFGAENSNSVMISTPFKDQRISIDNSYDYPSQVWNEIDVPESTDSVTLQVTSTRSATDAGILDRLPIGDTTDIGTRMGLPAIRPEQPQPPIFLISIDTLPYSEHESLQPIVDALGPDAAVPTEPRTQAHWTPPSHASMFTGTHPGDHGYVGHGKAAGDERPINPDRTTISELLTDNGYKCSGLASHTRILPEFGFGRGYHRYHADVMGYSDWISRDHDSNDSVSQMIKWINADRQVRDHSLFYFMHVFDPHYPYLPPFERLENDNLDLSKPSQYREQLDAARGETGDYRRMYQGNHDVDPDLPAEMERYHSQSIEYTAEQIARLADYLRSVDLFDDALIIITGDHGEEFGERGFFTHSSLYDRNIRPFMAIKPPASAEWSVPNAVDTIDFLPTIAHEIDADVPKHCAGEPIQSKGDDSDPRITERITPERYNVAVESDGIKGIFTYDSGYPDRPTDDVIDAGPVLTEFYDLEAVREGDFSVLDEPSNASDLKRTAEEFAKSGTKSYNSAVSATRPSQETEERLKDLGYM